MERIGGLLSLGLRENGRSQASTAFDNNGHLNLSPVYCSRVNDITDIICNKVAMNARRLSQMIHTHEEKRKWILGLFLLITVSRD